MSSFSHDIVNQLTMQFLIGKSQLEKLNRKEKEKKGEEIIDREALLALFDKLLSNSYPDDISYGIRETFQALVRQCTTYILEKKKEEEQRRRDEGEGEADATEEEEEDEDEDENGDAMARGDYVEQG